MSDPILMDGGDREKLAKLHKNLYFNNFDVPANFESFYETLRDKPETRAQLHQGLRAANFDVPEDFSSFENTLFPTDASAKTLNFTRNFLKGAAQIGPSMAYTAAAFDARGDQVRQQGMVAGANPLNPADQVSTGVGIIASYLEDGMKAVRNWMNDSEAPVSDDEKLFQNAGRDMERSLEELLPTDQRLTEGMINSTSLGQGFGQFASVMAAAATGNLAGVGGTIAASTGVFQMSGMEYKAAIDAGASEKEAFDVMVLNGALGATEALPVMSAISKAGRAGTLSSLKLLRKMGQARVAKRVYSATNGTPGRVLAQGFEGGLEELLQESVQTSLSNAIAQGSYDQAREIMDGVLESGANGGVIGFSSSLLLGAVAKARFRNPELYEQENPGGERTSEEDIINEIYAKADAQESYNENQAPTIPIDNSEIASASLEQGSQVEKVSKETIAETIAAAPPSSLAGPQTMQDYVDLAASGQLTFEQDTQAEPVQMEGEDPQRQAAIQARANELMSDMFNPMDQAEAMARATQEYEQALQERTQELTELKAETDSQVEMLIEQEPTPVEQREPLDPVVDQQIEFNPDDPSDWASQQSYIAEQVIDQGRADEFELVYEEYTSDPEAKRKVSKREMRVPIQLNEDNGTLQGIHPEGLHELVDYDLQFRKGDFSANGRASSSHMMGKPPRRRDQFFTRREDALGDNSKRYLIRNVRLERKPQPQQTESVLPATTQQDQGEFADSRVILPLSEISIDEQAFQGKLDYRQNVIDRIVNNYDPGRLDPVKVWKDENGKTWLLAGHHRLKAFQQMGKGSIPAQYIQANNLQEAVRFAKVESNASIGAQTPIENALVAMDMRTDGMSETELFEHLKENTGKNARLVMDLSHIPKGTKAYDAMVATRKQSESSDNANFQNLLQRIGNAVYTLEKMDGMRLTPEHIDQLFNHFSNYDNYKKINTKSGFVDFVIFKRSGLDESEPLPLGESAEQRRMNDMQRRYTKEYTDKLNGLRARQSALKGELEAKNAKGEPLYEKDEGGNLVYRDKKGNRVPKGTKGGRKTQLPTYREKLQARLQQQLEAINSDKDPSHVQGNRILPSGEVYLAGQETRQLLDYRGNPYESTKTLLDWMVEDKRQELKDVERELLELQGEESRKRFEAIGKEQTSMFDMFSTQTDATEANIQQGATPEQIEKISNATDQQIKSAESILPRPVDTERPESAQGSPSESSPSASDTGGQATYGANNRLVSRESFQQAEKEFNDRARNLGANPFLDPYMIARAAKIAVYHMEAGARSFAAFAQQMINSLGDGVKPHLGFLYKEARDAVPVHPEHDNDDAVDQAVDEMAVQDAFGAYFDVEEVSQDAVNQPIASNDELVAEGVVDPERDLGNQVDPFERAKRSVGTDVVSDQEQARAAKERGRRVAYRQYYENNKAVLDAQQQQMLEQAGNVRKESRLDRKLFADAHDIVAEYGMMGAYELFMRDDSSGKDAMRFDSSAVLGQFLSGMMERYIPNVDATEQAKLRDMQANIIEKLSQDATEMGRGLRAFRFLSRFSPASWMHKYKQAMEKKLDNVLDNGGEAEVQRVKAEMQAAFEQVLNQKQQEISELLERVYSLLDNKERDAHLINRLIDDVQQLRTEATRSAQEAANVREQLQAVQLELKNAKTTKASKAVIDNLTRQVQELGRKLKDQQAKTKKAADQASSLQAQYDEKVKELADSATSSNKGAGEAFKGFNQSKANKRPPVNPDQKTLWGRYRATIAQGVIKQLQQREPQIRPEQAPIQVLANAFITEIRGQLPVAEQVNKANSPRRQAILQIADVMRNPERHAEAMATVAEAIRADESISQADKEQALILLSAMDNQKVSLPLVRKAMSQQMAEHDAKIRELITANYDVDLRGRDRLVEALSEQAGLSPTEAAMLASRVDSVLRQEIISVKEQRVKAFFKRVESKFGTRRPGARKQAVEGKLVREVLELQRLGGFNKMADEDYRVLMARYLEISPSSEVMSQINRMASRVNQMPDSADKDQATLEMMAYIAEQKGFSKLNIMISLAYANMLSGIPTQVLNAGANAMNLVSNAFALYAINPKGRAVRSMAAGVAKGMVKGVYEMQRVLRTGYVTGSRLVKQDIGGDTLELIANSSNPIHRFFSNWKWVKRVMAATDVFFFKTAEEMNFYAQANAVVNKEGLKGEQAQARMAELLGEQERPGAVQDALDAGYQQGTREFNRYVEELIERRRDDEIQQQSVQFGLQATFNQEPEGVIGEVARAINRTINGFEKKANEYDGIARGAMMSTAVLARSVVPFTTVVSNVLNETINYTPFGFLRAGLIGSRAKHDPQAYKDNMHLTLAKATTSMVVSSIMLALNNAFEDDEEPLFRLHGGGTGDYRKDRQLAETGRINYSIQIGDTYIGLKESPFGLMMGLMGDYLDAQRYGKFDDTELSERLGYAMRMAATLPLEFGFLSGAVRLAESMSRDTVPDAKGAALKAVNTAKYFATPNLVRSIWKVFDPKVYTRDNIQEFIAASTPAAFTNNSRRPIINRLGEPIRQDWSPIEGVMSRFIRRQKSDPVWNFIASRKLFIPTPNPNSQTYIDPLTDKSMVMNENQFYNYIKMSGREIKSRLRAEIPAMRAMSNEQADKYMRAIVREANDRAKKAIANRSRSQAKMK